MLGGIAVGACVGTGEGTGVGVLVGVKVGKGLWVLVAPGLAVRVGIGAWVDLGLRAAVGGSVALGRSPVRSCDWHPRSRLRQRNSTQPGIIRRQGSPRVYERKRGLYGTLSFTGYLRSRCPGTW